jgi:diaminopimelate decarboxylase
LTQVETPPWAPVFPVDTAVNANGHLAIAGCDLVDLAREFGTPLYVFDERTIREQCRAFVQEFRSRHPATRVYYASKANLFRALASVIVSEGLGLDVVSGGELAIALAAGAAPADVAFHGNNKSDEELRAAVDAGVGRVIVDNFHELALLNDIAAGGERVAIALRVSPSIDPHTHGHTTTGILDSKFGFPIETGQAADAVQLAMAAPNLDLVGLHVHLGSPIFELEPYARASEVVVDFARKMEDTFGFEMREYSPGGGMAISYLEDTLAPPIADYAETVVSSLTDACGKFGLPVPTLSIEPGRSIVGRAGVALYTAGSRKQIPNLRTYVALDGGMADNIRPAIYGSRYTAQVANKPGAERSEVVTLAGKYCESGDILIRDITLPPLEAGDIVAIPAAGAYCTAMSSNYNAALRPPIVFLRDGKARLVRRRETFEDLMRPDVLDG